MPSCNLLFLIPSYLVHIPKLKILKIYIEMCKNMLRMFFFSVKKLLTGNLSCLINGMTKTTDPEFLRHNSKPATWSLPLKIKDNFLAPL